MKYAQTGKGILYTSLSLCIIFAFTYIVGRPLLTSFPPGSDTPSHLANIYYLDKYFPHIPLWHYKEGCGYPFLMLYPPMSYYICFFIHKVFSIGIFDSFNLTWFSSMFLAALGVYTFVRIKFRSNLIALSSSIFYSSYPLIWTMESLTGFISEIVAIPFFIFTLTFLTLYQDKGNKTYFFLTVLTYASTILAHVMVGFVTTVVLTVYSFIRVISKEITLKKGLFSLMKTMLAGLCLSSFWFIPFLSQNPLTIYGHTTLREPLDPLYFLEILPAILGFMGRTRIMGFGSFSICMTFFILIGGLVAFKKRGFFLWMLILGVFFNAFVLEYLFFQQKDVLDHILRFNFSIVMFLSMLGGLGVIETRKVLSISALKFIKRKCFITFIDTALFSVLVVLILSFSINHTHNLPVFGHGGISYPIALKLSEQINGDNFTRIDASPNLGGIMETLTFVSEVSQVNTYFFQGNLIRNFWGYQVGVFYGPFGGKTELRALANWFGIEYVVLSYADDPIWKYQNNNFTKVYSEGVVHLLKYENSKGLISVDNTPSFLVISSEEKNAYELIFRTATMSGLNPESTLLIHGESYIDDYTLDELQKFDALILHGYNYHDSDTAWELLRDYVFNGGGLFIETGWQYVNPDWNNPNIPMPCPVSMTFWTNYGEEWHFSHIDSPITNGINFTAFSPPVMGNDPWSFSSTNNESVREWAQTVLWNKGHPIIVTGNYGEGRVVWSGMNLISHAHRNNNYEECRFFAEIIRWMINRGTIKSDYEVTRPIPEKVVVSIHSTNEARSVLFREAYYYKWHAYLEKGDRRIELEIYRAGPDLMLVKIPAGINSPFKVVFEYKRSWIDWASVMISVTTLCTLGIYTFLPQALYVIYHPLGKFKKQVKDWWHEE